MTRYPSCFREEYNVKGEPTLLSKITATQYAVIKSNKFMVNHGLPRILSDTGKSIFKHFRGNCFNRVTYIIVRVIMGGFALTVKG